MKRREFLKMLGAAGAGATSSLGVVDLFAAHPDSYDGPLYLFVEANGGWDPTSLYDPKGYQIKDYVNLANNDFTQWINDYPAANIGNVGNIFFAPPPDGYLGNPAQPGQFGDFSGNYDISVFTGQDFLTAHANRMIVVNGIDYATGSHEVGRRNCWSGSRNRAQMPNFAALVAGTIGRERALPFLNAGSYGQTAGLTVAVPINSSGQDAIFEIARPNLTVPDNLASAMYHQSDVRTRIQQARQARKDAMLGQTGDIFEQRLLRIRSSIQGWWDSDRGRSHLEAFANDLQGGFQINGGNMRGAFNLDDANPARRMRGASDLYQQGRIALAAYQAGVSTTAHIRIGGFDTHGNHDNRHYPRLMNLMRGVDALLEEIDNRGLRNRVVMLVGSDFGRTNHFNGDSGKDHWSIGSNIIIGPGPGNTINVGGIAKSVVGGRVFGATSPDQRSLKVNPNTGVPDPNGVVLTPAHIHQAFRRFAGIDGLPTVLQPQFSLDVNPGEEINLFGV